MALVQPDGSAQWVTFERWSAPLQPIFWLMAFLTLLTAVRCKLVRRWDEQTYLQFRGQPLLTETATCNADSACPHLGVEPPQR